MELIIFVYEAIAPSRMGASLNMNSILLPLLVLTKVYILKSASSSEMEMLLANSISYGLTKIFEERGKPLQ